MSEGGKKAYQRPVATSEQAPASPSPIKWRLADLPGIEVERVAALKVEFLRHVRQTAKLHLSAERVGCTWPLMQRLLEADPTFREDMDQALQARVDELEMDIEGSKNRSGGDVTARIFALKGYRPERYMERIAQQTYSVQVLDPQVQFEVLKEDHGAEAPDKTSKTH